MLVQSYCFAYYKTYCCFDVPVAVTDVVSLLNCPSRSLPTFDFTLAYISNTHECLTKRLQILQECEETL